MSRVRAAPPVSSSVPAPPLAWQAHGNESPQDAVLFSMSDAPVLEALQLY